MKACIRRNNQEGYFLPLTLALLFLFTLVIIGLSTNINTSTRTRVRLTGQDKELNAAQEGIALGLNRVNQDTMTLTAIMAGQKIAHYSNDFLFRQLLSTIQNYGGASGSSGEKYLINITSGPKSHQITIQCSAAGPNSKSSSTVTAIYEDVSVNSAIFIESDPQKIDWSYKNTFVSSGTSIVNWNSGPVQICPEVHWGPIKCLRGIDITDDPSHPCDFPQRWAKNNVTGRDNGSTMFQSDFKEFWANSPNIETTPDFNLGNMLADAKNVNNHDNGGNNTYLSGSPINITTNLYINKNATWYFDGDLTISTGTFLRGIVIVMGDLHITAQAAGLNQAGFPGDMDNVPLPAGATAQYVKHVEATGDYPRFSGLQGNPFATIYNFPAGTVGMSAFIYVNGEVIVDPGINNPYTIYGSLYVKKKMTIPANSTFRVYYGDFLTPAPTLLRPEIARPSWKVVSWVDTIQ